MQHLSAYGVTSPEILHPAGSDVIGKSKKQVVIVAGEASADLHGANLVRAMKRRAPDIAFSGVGGDGMGDAGVDILFHSADMAVVGLTEVLSRLGIVARAYFTLKKRLKERPDLLILMDYPDFNLHLARAAKRFRVPVLYYISPQIWAWRTGRVKKLGERVDRMAVILPFEEAFYRVRGLNVTYVGHPLLDGLPERLNRGGMLRELGLEGGRPIIGLLPGSRKEEVVHLLPVMVAAAKRLESRLGALTCLLPVAPTLSREWIQSRLQGAPVRVTPTGGNIYRSLAVCDLAFVASGTATLETALAGVPMVIVYKVSPISYWIGKRIVRVPHIGLVNLVAEEGVVPELIQKDVTPQRLADEAATILGNSKMHENMLKKLGEVKDRLGRGGASERTAAIALEMIETSTVLPGHKPWREPS